jgi:hypothetical protein
MIHSKTTFEEIRLSNGSISIVDAEDYEVLTEYTWRLGVDGYAKRNTHKPYKGATMLMHRQIMDASAGQMLDHINRNKLDNRRANLRFVDARMNIWNREGGNFLFVPGVTVHRTGKLQAWWKGKYLGLFCTVEEAVEALKEHAGSQYLESMERTARILRGELP